MKQRKKHKPREGTKRKTDFGSNCNAASHALQLLIEDCCDEMGDCVGCPMYAECWPKWDHLWGKLQSHNLTFPEFYAFILAFVPLRREARLASHTSTHTNHAILLREIRQPVTISSSR